MNRIILVIALATFAAVSAHAAESSDAYLVPIAPSELRDGQGFSWLSTITGFNSSSREIPLECSTPDCPRAVPGQFYLGGARAAVERPSLVFAPRDRQPDLVLREEIAVKSVAGVAFQSHRFTVPMPRLSDIQSTKLTFLNVSASNYHDRLTFRFYSPLGEQAHGSLTLRVYFRADETGVNVPEYLAFERTYDLATFTANGISVGYAKIFWPAELANDLARTFPVRVEVESATPIWGFMTTTENILDPAPQLDRAPSVSVQLPIAIGDTLP